MIIKNEIRLNAIGLEANESYYKYPGSMCLPYLSVKTGTETRL